ncbi:cold-shock protein, partial [Acinetobacter sp. LH3_13]|uniref:cold-shock protein n=1 Tax=Acinetobacter sp. LH3_13 TaxID=3434463 RepID=UPI003EB73B1B
MFIEGKIKTYNEERGFGFIQIEGEPKDLFFHIKDFPNRPCILEVVVISFHYMQIVEFVIDL